VNFNLILKYNRCLMRIFSLIFCILNAELINAQSPIQDSLSAHSVKSDSSFSPKDNSKTANRIAVPTDTSVVVDTIEASKSDIDTRIQYSCKDSIRMSMAEQRVYLYGEAKVVYGSKNIQAEYLIINWVTNEVSAYGKLDTLTGKTIGKPLFKDGSDMYVADSIRYNMKSGKGIIKGIVTRQGDGFIHGGPVKRTQEAIYVKHALYTTCDLPHPHFSINASKLKVIPGDKVVTGPFHMEIMGIPTPLGLPLGFFPVTKRSKSGIIFPSGGESRSRGFYISNGGYYWAVNDYVGAKVFGDLYANKSYRISAQTNYIKRYCYSGLTAFSYSKIQEGFADSTSTKAPKLFNFRWSHTTIGNKPSRLSADVNISSSKFYTTNSYNPINRQSTNFASNITWSKTFRNSPFNVSVAVRQDQNTVTKAMTVTLPEVNVSMNRIYPFRSKVNPGNKWYEKINVSYNGSTKYTATNHLQNVRLNGSEVAYADTTINIQGNLNTIINQGQWGVHNTVPIGTTFKVFKYLSLNPSLNIENWVYANRLNYNISHTQTGAVVAQPSPDKQNGLNTVFSGNFTTALTTRIYGTYRVNTKFLQGIRHTLIPTFTYTYRPDIKDLAGDNAFYTNSAVMNKGKETPYSRYQGYVYGGPASGTVNSLSISLQNTVEGKARNRKDTTGLNATKKIKLIENLSVAGAYNFSADSLKWSLINVSANSRLFDKISINFTSTFDPYQTILDSVHGTTLAQKRVDRLAFDSPTNKKFLILTNYNIALSTNLNPKGQKSQAPVSNINPNAANYLIAGAGQYVDFTIPWNLSVAYNIQYSKIGVAPATYINTLTFKGDIKVSDNWKVGFSSGFDVVKQQLPYTTVNVYRDLHCWQMNLSLVPFGTAQSFMFTLNAKSSLLTDLKITKQNATYNGGY